MAEFDIRALHAALDAERQARRLSWTALAKEIAGPVATGQRTISATSFSGMATRRALNGNVVMAALRWLDRTPESFIPGHPDAASRPPLPGDLPRGFYRRWDLTGLHEALDARRGDRPWAEIAREIGVSPALLRSYADPETFVGFPDVMRVTQWLGRPLTDFVDRE